jgi:hypothetical protein
MQTVASTIGESDPSGGHPENNQVDSQVNNESEAGIELAEKAALLQVEGTQIGQSDRLARVQSELVNTYNPSRFSLAQRRLESGAEWTDETRMLALEINRADQDLRGVSPLTFEEAKAKIEMIVEADLSSDESDTKRSGRSLDSALRGVARPDLAIQYESLDILLADVERTLYGYELSDITRTPEFEAEIRDYRAIRDALVLKRAEIKAAADRNRTEDKEGVYKTKLEDAARAELKLIYDGDNKADDAAQLDAEGTVVTEHDFEKEPSQAQQRFTDILSLATRAAQSPNIARSLAAARGLSDQELARVADRLNEIRKYFAGTKRDAIVSGSTNTWVKSFEDAVLDLNGQIEDGSIFE